VSPSRSGKPYFKEFDKVRIDPSSGWSGGLFRPRGKKFVSGKKSAQAKVPEAPGLIGVLSSTLNLVQDRVTRSRLAADPPDVNIVPRVGHVGLLDFHAAVECIEAGAAAVYQAEDDIRDAMSMFDEVVA
jgi:predicted acylesterase/phospholipase RssA